MACRRRPVSAVTKLSASSTNSGHVSLLSVRDAERRVTKTTCRVPRCISPGDSGFLEPRIQFFVRPERGDSRAAKVGLNPDVAIRPIAGAPIEIPGDRSRNWCTGGLRISRSGHHGHLRRPKRGARKKETMMAKSDVTTDAEAKVSENMSNNAVRRKVQRRTERAGTASRTRENKAAVTVALERALGLASRGNRRSRRDLDRVVDVAAELDLAIDRIYSFFIRYSTKEIEGLLGQTNLTLKPYAHRPGVQDVIDNMRVLVSDTPEGEALRAKWGVETMVWRTRVTGWFFEREGSFYAVGMEPASQDTADKDDNCWVRSISQVIREIGRSGRPLVSATNVGRLGSLPIYRQPPEASLVATRAEVRADMLPAGFVLADCQDRLEKFIWDIALNMAGTDWSATVIRLSEGSAGQLGEGVWPFSERQLMRGWKMGGVDRYGMVAKPHRTYPDSAFRPVLRDVIELGCSALNDAELCQELARRHGDKLTTDAMIRDHGEGALLSNATSIPQAQSSRSISTFRST